MKQQGINGKTQIIGIFGWPLTYTLSPVFQNAGLRAAGVNACYLPLPVEAKAFPALFKAMSALPNFVGANVTNPHKLAAVKLADRLTRQAKRAGAVNTLYRQGKFWVGHNTDGEGFVSALPLKLTGQRVLILGAGGAARAIAAAALDAGAASVDVAARRPQQGRALLRQLQARRSRVRDLEAEDLALLLATATVIVNTVPGPAFALRAAAALARLPRRGKVVCEISYVPVDTALLKAARLNGHRAVNGLGMLLEQGLASFTRFTGKKAPRAAMARVLR